MIHALLIGLNFIVPAFGPKDSTAFWPQWRGAHRDGVSTDTGLLKKWPEGGPKLLWTAHGAGEGYGSVSVADGRVFVLGSRGEYEYTVNLDLPTGGENWARSNGKTYRNSYGDGPRSTPTIDEDRVYVLGANGELSCMKVKTGQTTWTTNILSQFKGQNPRWGISESPLIDGVRLIVMPGGRDGSVVALNKFDGSIVWKASGLSDGAAYASGIMADVEGVKQVIHFTDAAAVGIRAEDGIVLWRNTKPSNRVANCTTPIYHDGLAFITSAYDTGAVLLKLISKDGKTHAGEQYFSRDMMNHHGGVVLVDRHVYGFSNNTLMCMEFETGKVKWKDRSVGKGCLCAADGMLYCLGERGIMGLVRATPEKYDEVSRFSFELQNANAWAHPVVTGGKLFIRNGDEVRCYDVTGK